METSDYYNIQCMCGSVWREPANTDLGIRAAEREARGYLDALAVPTCASCERDHEPADYWTDNDFTWG